MDNVVFFYNNHGNACKTHANIKGVEEWQGILHEYSADKLNCLELNLLKSKCFFWMREKGVYQKQGMSSIISFLNSQGDFKSIFLIKMEGGW